VQRKVGGLPSWFMVDSDRCICEEALSVDETTILPLSSYLDIGNTDINIKVSLSLLVAHSQQRGPRGLP
jgi:hypothetical protein